ncbi:WhiB family transcriptional regulator [Streptomyces sp. NPDC046371]|uniref:WhiB family transcriptional regulator n=1 Tax=Streptomyces sp. NPDC046371 TaxID=3154916 RepID=UPI0033C15176
MTTATDAYLALTENRHYHYRGCAPDPDKTAFSAADDELPLDAWGSSTVDGGLEQTERFAQQRRAIAICGRCPVRDACAAYANAELPGGGLAEPEGVWGGQTSLERHRALIDRRATQPVLAEPATALAKLSKESRDAKRRLLAALARETDDELVAYRAHMDVRTANWHRSALCTLLGLDKERATRQQLLDAARACGILPARTRIVPDGSWPIVAAPTADGVRQRRIERGRPIQLVIPGLPDYPRVRPTPAPAPVRHLVLTRPAPDTALLPLPVRTLETAA